MATVEDAERELLELYRRKAPRVGDVIEQQAFLDHVRHNGMSWVDLARGVDFLVARGHLRAVVGPPYGWQLTSSGAALVAECR